MSKLYTYKGREVYLHQQTENYSLVSFTPNIEIGLFSVKHKELTKIKKK